MTEMLTSEVLDLAADKIRERGWTQGLGGWPGWGPDDALCLEGGIMAALGYDEETPERLYRGCPAFGAVRDYLGLGDDFLFPWNDASGRTQQEVIEVLRAAAAVERAKEAVAGYEATDQPLPLEIPAEMVA